jgi:hypothetical protein
MFGGGRTGASVPDAAVGGRNGFRVGRARKMGGILKKRKESIARVLADSKYPIIKRHSLDARQQVDWVAGTQGVVNFFSGYSSSEIERMMLQSQDATYNPPTIVPFSPDGLTNQKMDVYSRTMKTNIKNTCSHTVYLEIRLYKCKGYHSYRVDDAWNQALANDNMVANAGTWGTEMISTDIGARPNMSMAELNVRYSEVKAGKFNIVLEPGQETHYTHVCPGFRYDQQKWNVQQGSGAFPVDPDYTPHTYGIVLFARSEMVTDSVDADVNYGSGHLALNSEVWSSWAAVPWCKPRQASFVNSWGAIAQANEEDINQADIQQEVYFENV